MHVFSLQCTCFLWKTSQNRWHQHDGRQSYQMNSSAHYGGSRWMWFHGKEVWFQEKDLEWLACCQHPHRQFFCHSYRHLRYHWLLPVTYYQHCSGPSSRFPKFSVCGSSLPYTADSGDVSIVHYRLGHAVNYTSLIQVPSLLSLGSLDHMGNSGGSVYWQHSGFGLGRYQDRGPNKCKCMDSRRQEP